MPESEIIKTYGNRVRVRACGLCWEGNSLLLIDHQHLGQEHFWAPPGGGVDFGTSARETLVKEFEEETGLIVTAGNHLFTCEFIHPPFHAIELFFEVQVKGGTLKTGADPETRALVIGNVQFIDFAALSNLPANQRHGIFNMAATVQEIRSLQGFIPLL